MAPVICIKCFVIYPIFLWCIKQSIPLYILMFCLIVLNSVLYVIPLIYHGTQKYIIQRQYAYRSWLHAAFSALFCYAASDHQSTIYLWSKYGSNSSLNKWPMICIDRGYWNAGVIESILRKYIPLVCMVLEGIFKLIMQFLSTWGQGILMGTLS